MKAFYFSRCPLRIPITAGPKLFSDAAQLGRAVIWLHTFGGRFADASQDRPNRPRLAPEDAPQIPAEGAISQDPAEMPDSIDYDAANRRLLVGNGYITNVSSEVWNYEVSGKQILRQWFSYRKKNRERPIIGNRRQPSALNKIQPDYWPSEYTTELLNLLHVLGRLVQLEPSQADLLDQICSSETISSEELKDAGALDKVLPKASRSAPTGYPDQIPIDFLDD